MKQIGLNGTQALTPKGKPSTSLKTGGKGHKPMGRSANSITGLKAQALGHKPMGRSGTAITKLRAPKTMETI